MCFSDSVLCFVNGKQSRYDETFLPPSDEIWETAMKLVHKYYQPYVIEQYRFQLPYVDFLLEKTLFGWRKYYVVYYSKTDYPFEKVENKCEEVLRVRMNLNQPFVQL